jgi:heme/copper-type cytochrome/quinol oxidase subunit 2
MKRCKKLKWLGLLPVLALSLHADAAHACAACFGRSDSPLAAAMNWGIFSLMAVVVSVLGGIAGFFVYLARRSAALNAPATPAPQGEMLASTQKV